MLCQHLRLAWMNDALLLQERKKHFAALQRVFLHRLHVMLLHFNHVLILWPGSNRRLQWRFHEYPQGFPEGDIADACVSKLTVHTSCSSLE